MEKTLLALKEIDTNLILVKPDEFKGNILRVYELIYDGLCILNAYYEKDMSLYDSFHMILKSLAYSFDKFLRHIGNCAQFEERVSALKNDFFTKMFCILGDELSKPEVYQNDCLNIFNVS